MTEHFRTVATEYWGEFKSQVRAVDVAPRGDGYLFTLADEAWYCDIDGKTILGVQTPLNEGWERVVARSGSEGTGAEVHGALALLGLSLPVTASEVKQAYRRLALVHHPDRNPDDPRATMRMRQLNTAFAVLTGVDPASLSLEVGDLTMFRHVGGGLRIDVPGGMAFRIDLGTSRAQDWVYGATFTPDGGALICTYSGKVVAVDATGQATHVYDAGTAAPEARRLGAYTYIWCRTRLWVLRDTALTAFIDIFGEGRLVFSDQGFGLLQSKRLRWFSPDGSELGQVETRDPIRVLHAGPTGTMIETLQHRAIIEGLQW